MRNKPIDDEYFQLLALEVDFLDAGCDVIAARENAKLELLRRRNADAQYDRDHEDRGR
jgi:hypothetical protein